MVKGARIIEVFTNLWCAWHPGGYFRTGLSTVAGATTREEARA